MVLCLLIIEEFLQKIISACLNGELLFMFERVDNSVANSSFVLVSAHTSNKIAVYKDIF